MGRLQYPELLAQTLRPQARQPASLRRPSARSADECAVRHHGRVMPEARVVIPEARRRDVLVHPILSGIVVGVAISAVVSIWLAVTGELDAADSSATANLAIPALLLAARGELQAVWWSHQLGGVRYEADDATLRVLRRDAVISEWRRGEIRRLRVDGVIDWYALVVLKAGVDDFPPAPWEKDIAGLVVESSDGVIRAPGLLIWGRDNAQRIQRSLVDMHRTHSH